MVRVPRVLNIFNRECSIICIKINFEHLIEHQIIFKAMVYGLKESLNLCWKNIQNL